MRISKRGGGKGFMNSATLALSRASKPPWLVDFTCTVVEGMSSGPLTVITTVATPPRKPRWRSQVI